MNLKQIRCKNCKKRLFDGSPGFDIIGNKPKIIEVKCPKCGAMNLSSCEILEEVIVKLKE